MIPQTEHGEASVWIRMRAFWRRRLDATRSRPRPDRLVFVLGGGGSRGACTVGVLRALLEAGILPDGVVGCSSGAFNAAALAMRPDLQTIDRLAEVWESIRNRDLFNRNPLRMAYRYARSRNSFFDSRYLRALAARHLPPTFDDLTLPCAIIATNLTLARKEVFASGSIPDAVAASSAIPGVFNPYRIGDQEYVDGAVSENVGIAEAVAMGATRIVAVDNSTANPLRRPPSSNLPGVLAQSVQIMLAQRTLEEYQRWADQVEISLLVPNVEFATVGTDFTHSHRLIDEAYVRTRVFLRDGGGLRPDGRVELGIHYLLPSRGDTIVSLAQ
ncbi:MAG TPA: patatin-like phospholipase family protein [Candidatus Limnocylindrales bacterium]|nr:patatin-like phospholipase family protein [Candidatus Limnocylindrales bacterium]